MGITVPLDRVFGNRGVGNTSSFCVLFWQIFAFFLHSLGRSVIYNQHYCKQLEEVFSIACVATRYKAWVCGRWIDGIAGSNLAGGIYVCVLRMLCVVR